ncbi:hypothetical protein A8C56_14915 [Niabella ginsenosidivorans]|uniref:Uncharacterized protein n=1 Tax=Niabella ginsenosidivorans TaxID=1176587 RepID=A0A1A9I3I3_9BACT|nr:hypothetical protein A8C56_14915 [Niabella ginsenosidivorans]
MWNQPHGFPGLKTLPAHYLEIAIIKCRGVAPAECANEETSVRYYNNNSGELQARGIRAEKTILPTDNIRRFIEGQALYQPLYPSWAKQLLL